MKLDPEKDNTRLKAVKAERRHDLAQWREGPRCPTSSPRKRFGDCEVHVEFLIAKGSNAGIKFHEVYEIQILDSYGKKKVDWHRHGRHLSACGLKKGGYLDKGIAPKVNAAKPAGEWQHARRDLEVAAHSTPRARRPRAP